MKRFGAKAYIAAGSLLAMVLGGAWYWQSPVWALGALRQAALDEDASELSQRVDLAALRDQARLRRGQPVGSDAETGELGRSLAAAVSDALLNARLNLGSVQTLLLTGQALGAPRELHPKAITWTITTRGLNVFRVRADAAGGVNGAELMFRRDGLSWKLVGISGMPDLALADPEREDLAHLVLDFPPNRQDRRTLPNGAEFLGVSGSITNVGNFAKSVPSVAGTLRDSFGRAIFTHDIVPSKSRLSAGESITINEAIIDFPQEAAIAEIGWKLRVGRSIPPVTRLGIAAATDGTATTSSVYRLTGGTANSPASQAEREAIRLADEAAAEASEAASLDAGVGR